ncbi:MAG: gluconate 2-dehydrogenase subunit 3 family protein [Pseudomonadota bacterium]|nr:gluconate 2-dehydrogenase subunit 3 family protein [Pseudomonadota bacterium]
MIDRRKTLKWLAASMVSLTSAHQVAARPPSDTSMSSDAAGLGTPKPVTGTGYGPDPDLINPTVPWEMTMTDEQLRVAASLSDMILPADDVSPSASAVGVPAFIDEWVSAPYPDQQRDRKIVFDGLLWLEQQSIEQFDAGFADATNGQRSSLLDQIAFADKVENGLKTQHDFFRVYRNLTMSAFYATEEGMADIGYIGNIPVAGEYPGPTPEALAHLEKALNSLGLEMPEA